MKFKTFNKANAATTHAYREPVIHLNKQGQISFNRAACEKFKLTEGGGIEFKQDESTPADWYFHPSKSKEAFILRLTGKNGSLLCNSSGIVRQILSDTGNEDAKSMSCKIAPEPELDGKTEIFAILTAGAKVRE